MGLYSTNKDWREAKQKAKAVGINVNVFKEDFSGAYDTVCKEADHVADAEKTLITAQKKLGEIAGKYKKTCNDYATKYKKEDATKARIASDMADICNTFERWVDGKAASVKASLMSTDWKNAKASAKKAGLDTSVFKDDFASTFDQVIKEHERLASARKTCLKEVEKFLKIADKYKKICQAYIDEYYRFEATSDKNGAARDMAHACSSMESWGQIVRRKASTSFS